MKCEGIVKTATISFGQAMPEIQMARAQDETMACDLFIVVGSSLVVYPAAGFPQLAKRKGEARGRARASRPTRTTPADLHAPWRRSKKADTGARVDGVPRCSFAQPSLPVGPPAP